MRAEAKRRPPLDAGRHGVTVWRDQVVPRLVDKLNPAATRELRARATVGLVGDVVEIGFGSGLNLPHYPIEVSGVWAVEPSLLARRLAGGRVASCAAPVRFAGSDAAELPFPTERFDSALSTLTLCTVPDATAALREVARVLKPGGRFHFAEHGLSPDPPVARWQRRLEPLQGAVFAGCHLTRDIAALVAGSGLVVDRLHADYAPGPRFVRPFAYIFEGVARKP